jgi:methylenetetrahydrofolate dehydrogenase (NADP+)/methenyltetrahydrofolate cyclohydrolase
MKEKIIDGIKYSTELREEVRVKTDSLKSKYGLSVCLAVVIVGKDPASEIYVKNKSKFALECGFISRKIELPVETTEEELLSQIKSLNKDKSVNGILVQLPLPRHISKEKVINTILPEKDVDGFHQHNAGLLFTDQANMNSTLIPCTPKGSLMLIKKALGNNLTGKKCVVIGASNIVGRPMFALLLNEKCTVTVTHSKTKDLKKELENAEIVVIGVGVPYLLKADMIPQNAVIIDVGINRVKTAEGKTKIVGDVDFEGILPKASHITPVPGGVGPMTIACLLQNTIIATCKQNNIDYSSL